MSSTRPLRVKATILVLLAAMTGAMVEPSRSAFVDSTENSGSELSAMDCWEAQLKGVQTGTTTSNGNGTVTVNLPTSVDPAKAFLVFTTSHNNANPGGAMIRGQLNSTGTAVDFVRVTNQTNVITIRWHVVEYSCGVKVQRGLVTQDALVNNVAISPVTSRSQAFVLHSKTPVAGDATWGNDDWVLSELTSNSNLQFRVHATNPAHIVAWQVVEFVHPSYAQVQRGTANFNPTSSTSMTINLPTPVDLGHTFVLVDSRANATGNSVAPRMVRARLTGPSTLVIDRSGASQEVEVSWQVVTLNDGSRVQQGSRSFASGAASHSVAIDPVDVSRSTAFTSTQAGSGQNAGMTNYTADDVIGVSSFTATLSATSVTLARDNTAAAADAAWFVVEWGGPGWWNNAYSQRRVIEVSTSSAAIEAGYSVSLTFDHAAMVAAGRSRADGDDIRIVHWNGTSWVELDRLLATDWNSSTTTVWFKAVPGLPTDATYRNHFLYYGNPEAGPAPASPGNVWLFHDDFESGTLGKWTDKVPSDPWFSQAQADWYTGWSYRKPLTIHASQVSGSGTLTDFPVLISVTDIALANALANGNDFVFTAGNGTTKLSHEIESWNPATGTLVAWVKVPSLSGSTDTPLYLYYGNAGASNQQNPNGVWTNGYQAVWHMAQNPAGTAPQVIDSTANNRHATTFGSMPASALVGGRINGALDFDGGDDHLEAASFNINVNAMTLSGWFRVDTFGAGGGNDPRLISKAPNHSNHVWQLGIDDANANQGRLRFRIRAAGAAITELHGTTNAIGVNQWYYAVATWDGATMRIYQNGEPDTSVASVGTLGTSNDPIWIADNQTGSRALNGIFDEARVSSVARSGDWIRTEYNNQANPGVFHTLGAQQTPQPMNWSYRKAVTLHASQVAASQTDFPVLISIQSDSELAAGARSDGADIVFTLTNGTKLAHEIESYNPATGALIAWVKVPSLSGTTDTSLYLYFGNPGSLSQQNVAGVWSNGYVGVWHLGETPTGDAVGPAGQIKDSTSNANHGFTRGSMNSADQIAGRVGGSLDFDGTNDAVQFPYSASMNTAALTASGWVRKNAHTAGWNMLTSRQAGTGSGDLWLTGYDSGTNNYAYFLQSAGGNTGVSSNADLNQWVYVNLTYDGGANPRARMFRNSAQIASNNTAVTLTGETSHICLAAGANDSSRNCTSELSNVALDEVRVSSVARSQTWIETEYNNQSSPQTFHTIGGQQVPGAGGWKATSTQSRSGSHAMEAPNVSSSLAWITANGIAESNLLVSSYWKVTDTQLNIAQGQRTSSSLPANQYEVNLANGWSLAKVISGSWTSLAGPVGSPPPTDEWAQITTIVTGTDMRALLNGTQIVPAAGWTGVGSELTSGSIGFRAWQIATGDKWWIDDVIARRYVTPEPTTALGVVDRP